MNYSDKLMKLVEHLNGVSATLAVMASDLGRDAAKAAVPTTQKDTNQEGPPREAALEEAAVIAENWGNAPPNPNGRRAALAAEIRKLKKPIGGGHMCSMGYLPLEAAPEKRWRFEASHD